MHACALFRRFPELEQGIPWLSIAQTPTAVEPLETEAGDLWIKRDDLTAEPYGGNKVRKLEFLLAAARARGATRIITVGAAGSHHALATTIYGRRFGFDVTLVLFPQPLTQHVRGILLLDHVFGAELRYTRRMELVPAALFATTLRYRNQGACVIPAGGSDAVGTLGYVSAALELAEQVASGSVPEPKTVVVAAGTLGTAAGLALGFAIAGMKTRIKAIRITSRIVTNERALGRLVRGAEVLLRRAGVQSNFAADAIGRVELMHEHIGRGYGMATEEGERATAQFRARGIHLDATYTAKAAAAFVAHTGELPRPVLLWHTLSAREPLELIEGVDEAALPRPFREYLLALPTATG